MSSVHDYDYELPRELIAQQPLARRSDARLLAVNRHTGELTHSSVGELGRWLRPGDTLVVNDTRVVPARFFGRRVETGGQFEGLFLAALEGGLWRILAKSKGRLRAGQRVTLVDAAGRAAFDLELLDKQPEGVWTVRPQTAASVWDALGQVGHVPLPHYIRRGEAQAKDFSRYQTVYARVPGSAAAPTAGLHLTEELLAEVEQAGIAVERVTLHVGLDTFRPLKVENLEEHPMHSEWCQVTAQTAQRLNERREAGGRIVAVGTTTVRTLETAAATGRLQAHDGPTELFIRPPYVFCAVDALLTNFHLPRSTLLVLVSTLAGRELIQRAYAEAIAERYRFYSYGDAMLIC